MVTQRLFAAAVMVAGATGFAAADITEVVPNAFANASAGSAFLGPLANSQRTYQMLIHESQLTSLVGLELNGLTWRLPPAATVGWPVDTLTYDNYDIYLSNSVNPEDRSFTFADNVVGTQTQVRSGSLVFGADSLTAGGNPNEFGLTIDFSNYLYTGGNLLIEIRHTGSDGLSRSVDAIGASAGGPVGYGTLFSAAWTGNYTGTEGVQGNFAVTQLRAIPTPGAASVLMLAGLAAARRRR
ncbi:MAG: hypothetical protein LAT64_09330 [Phycisphaerales bacterium]|nr:hypothetical protein [Planctomycetota bacterium]MCH8508951.1 hypothetical protein [Phycisphaerales bacterium]